jgi:RimJ/RimL family protein N-acetyltransferase
MCLKLETSRLILRPFCDEDAALLFELNNDFEVIRYTGDVSYKNIEEALHFIRNYEQYEKYQMGRLNMFARQSGQYIGWCGLKYLSDIKEVDLGYRLLKQSWGKGYATEASIACLDYGFKILNLKKIIAAAMEANTASIRVLEKLGLKYSHDNYCGGQPGVVYSIIKEEWK